MVTKGDQSHERPTKFGRRSRPHSEMVCMHESFIMYQYIVKKTHQGSNCVNVYTAKHLTWINATTLKKLLYDQRSVTSPNIHCIHVQCTCMHTYMFMRTLYIYSNITLYILISSYNNAYLYKDNHDNTKRRLSQQLVYIPTHQVKQVTSRVFPRPFQCGAALRCSLANLHMIVPHYFNHQQQQLAEVQVCQ